jgi:hypothetical protein
MAFGIGLKSTGDTASRLRYYWTKFGPFESSPSMAALDHPPHVTLTVYDRIPVRELIAALRSVFDGHPPIPLRFTKLAIFETPEPIIWAAPERSEPLLRAHDAIHRLIDPCLCWSHYTPQAWIPHCTLATQVTANARKEAITAAAEAIEPFEVVFDKAECVEFYPIRIIEERSLSTALADKVP